MGNCTLSSLDLSSHLLLPLTHNKTVYFFDTTHLISTLLLVVDNKIQSVTRQCIHHFFITIIAIVSEQRDP